MSLSDGDLFEVAGAGAPRNAAQTSNEAVKLDYHSLSQGISRRMGHNADQSLRRLLIAQVLGAFNDNVIKVVVALLAMAAVTVGVTDVSEQEVLGNIETTWAFAIFTLPLMLFSFPAALWVDRWSKRSVLVVMKGVEVALMMAATAALYVQPVGGALILIVLAGMGAQSAIFSPAKYGMLPEMMPGEKLVASNGKLEMWTMIAIIAGSGVAGLLLKASQGHTWLIGAFLTVWSIVGFLSIRGLPAVPPVGGAASMREAFGSALRSMRDSRVLWLGALGSVFFWGVASLVTQNALVYARTTLQLDQDQASLPLAASGVGIAVGASLVAWLSRGRLDLGWIPLGSIGLAIACAGIGVFETGFEGTLFWMFAMGVSSGWVVVPLNTMIQTKAPAKQCGAVIAMVNAMAFAGILAGTLGCFAFAMFDISPVGIFVGAALVTVVGTAWAIYLLPEAGARLVLILLTQTLYKLRVVGRHHVPAEGGALLVCNHVSFVDGLLLSASIDRSIRFLVEEDYYNKPLLKPFMKLFGFVPIAQKAPPRELLKSIRRAGEALDQGELVCIFAEGEITRTGQLLPFRRGYSRITKGRDVPVLPVQLDRVWGSLTSFRSEGLWNALKSLPRKVSVSFGAPLPPDVPAPDLRTKVRELECAAWNTRIEDAAPLHRTFVSSVRRGPFRLCAADERAPKVSRLRMLTSAVALARALRSDWAGQDRVGVLLPPSVSGAAINIAASLAGKTSVNLNFTTGADAMAAAASRAELLTVITNREFLEKADVELPDGVRPIYIEDVAAGLGGLQRVVAMGLAMLAPKRWLERACGAVREIRATDVATVIFSSGSTGEPKGVELTHFNLGANADSVRQALPVTADDRLLGSLPLFHSFGTMGLWFALRAGMATVFQPNPLDAPKVGELVQSYGITLLIATPTFLQIYTRRCMPGQFGSLRLVVVGAEKLPERVATAFEQKFGVRPLEGYGATECAPVVAVSTPGYRAPGFYQAGAKRGSVGQPVPGVAVRIVDPDTREPVPVGEPGLLEVSGPNVMRGYLGRDDLTQKVLADGWYSTGDIAKLDEDGYVTITDRLSRFSKIGGEMVPHGVVETALHELVESVEQRFAVTGVPSEKKGEELAVLHTVDEATIPQLVEQLKERGLPNLFVPHQRSFVRVDALPLLGTGKLDLRALKAIAAERLGVSQAANS